MAAGGAGLSPAEAHMMLLLLSLFTVGSIGLVIFGGGTLYVANRLMRDVLSKLVERRVHGEELAKVRTTLAHHVPGICASITSTWAVVAANFLNGANALGGSDSAEVLVQAVSGSLDYAGDIVAILLLSGISTRLIKEDPDAGDISKSIRSILHSAVLTSQAEMTFEGRVDSGVRSGICVASFPGKFVADWHAFTWAYEQGDFGSACVFLPKADPLHRFGQHEANPATPGKCWCYSLYSGGVFGSTLGG